ncbi:MAG: M61 family metallopeptidase [Pyrinomonadaceae bacterium]|nr:M61 family metallopeptidase [Pyrinomonadaceae bacterium]MBP6213142.1 M61 family metallopeptidase [Pyrinomonadaceae bacterium]
MLYFRRAVPSFVVLAILLFVQTSLAQKDKLDITYTVSLTDIASQQFRVTTDIKNIDQPRLDLALPTWAPGWYTVENYFKNVLRFRITDAAGKPLPLRMSRKQTWNVDTRGIKQIRVDYDYSATILGLNQAKIATDFAFFTGIQLFLEPLGHRSTPSTVKFQIPAGWKLMTALKETADPSVFKAADYDTLVDAPAMMGKFDVTQFEVEGKPHYFVAAPAGAFNAEKSKKFTEIWASTIKAQSAIFGGLPYEKYVAFYFFMPAQSNASGALEHLNSYVAFAPAGERATPEGIIGTGSHEFFHLWNVKRIRPAEMWPYDYSRENETPLLWVSEGFTNYYGIVATYRGGVTSKEDFLANVAGAAAGIESNEARKYISPANASVSTWVGYDTPVAFGISYYGQGQNLAALLDLSIRHDSEAQYNLDDVMRALYNEHYKWNKGFTTSDLIGIINRLTKKDYNEFFNRYVFGTDVPDYDRIFGYAGYNLVKKTEASPDFGFNVRPRNGGFTVNGVEPNGPADAAKIKIGDVITKINGGSPFEAPFGTFAGKEIKLTITRDGADMEIPLKVGSRDFQSYSLAEMPAATATQLKVREGWLKR